MITFKQYLTEEKKFPNLLDILKKDCKPFLEEAKGNGLLFRGVNDLGTPKKVSIPWVIDGMEPGEPINLYKKAVRNDRQPKDSSVLAHNIVNEWFKDEFGYPARSETIFCIGMIGKYGDESAGIVRKYGTPRVVFPIGKFEYVWATDVHDLFQQLHAMQTPNISEEELRKKIHRFLDHADYSHRYLKNALNQGNEIMVRCKNYYAIDVEHAYDLKEWMKTL